MSQLNLFERPQPEAQSPQQDKLDLIVFRLFSLMADIRNQPLNVRAQLVSLLESELQPLANATYAELMQDETELIRWSDWREENLPQLETQTATRR